MRRIATVLGLIGGKLLEKVLEPSLPKLVRDFGGLSVGSALLAWGLKKMLASDLGIVASAKLRDWMAQVRQWLRRIFPGDVAARVSRSA